MHRVRSWLCELLQTIVQYLGVAACSLPATLIYFLALRISGHTTVAMVTALAIGFSCAYLVWNGLGRMFSFAMDHPRPKNQIAPAVAKSSIVSSTPVIH